MQFGVKVLKEICEAYLYVTNFICYSPINFEKWSGSFYVVHTLVSSGNSYLCSYFIWDQREENLIMH